MVVVVCSDALVVAVVIGQDPRAVVVVPPKKAPTLGTVTATSVAVWEVALVTNHPVNKECTNMVLFGAITAGVVAVAGEVTVPIVMYTV